MDTILHQTNSAFEFNFLYVIESLDVNDGDKLTGTELLKKLKPYAEQCKVLSTALIPVENAHQFREAMTFLRNKATEGQRPVVHFEIHGTDKKNGLYIKNGEVIEWQEVLDSISDINYASGCNLLTSFAVCYGQYLAQFINADKRMPFCISLGSFEELYEDDLEVRFFAFYKELLTSFNIDKAYQALLDVAPGMPSNYSLIKADVLFANVMKDYLEREYGEDAKNRIYATTDKAKGTLKKLSDEKGYETFVIPDDVGGRFSVLTPVGLLPIAVAGLDIDALMSGAQQAMKDFDNSDLDTNDCYKYAALRSIMLRKGKVTEVTVGYEPYIASFCEWIKQLHGESEGKNNKGLFPASMIFSTDLHSLGQYVQQGLRNLFETVLWIKNPKIDLSILSDPNNLDGLNFLSDKTLNEINRNAFMGTVLAHVEGGVPNIILELEDSSEYSVGYMIYFYEKACAIAGYLNGVNPFDQPGVESYKKNMFALLGKPGYESMRAELEAKLK